MSVTYRPALLGELERAQALVVSSINDLTQRHGFGRMASVRPPHFQAFSLRDDPDGLWTAEENGELLGTAFSWACGDLWFLAELFVSRDHQGRGIGNELLKQTLRHAQKAGTTNKALITFAFNAISQALYIRHGMFPRTPVYMMSVAREPLLELLQGDELRMTPIDSSASHLATLSRIDGRALGLSREKHHRFLIGDDTIKGVLLHSGSDCIGYAYVNSGGHVGPLAVTERGALAAAFRTALRLAGDSAAAQVSAFVPGVAEAALSVAVQNGMRIEFPMLLMSSREFGDWTLYLPRNPGFM
jgi:GNAT superfamily N-acetyltransferase